MAWPATITLLAACAASGPETNAQRGAHGPIIDRDCIAQGRAGFPPGLPPPTGDTIKPVQTPGKRIAGDPVVSPDAASMDGMRESHLSRVSATAKICLGTDGVPTTIDVVRSSCFPRWDARIVDAIKLWRYAPPYAADGTALAICTHVNFIFAVQ